MLKIGVFSQLAQVTIKTLHYYDRHDLLKPIFVDPDSGYRFYSVEQMAQLNRILALKNLGFSLDQIKFILDDDLPAAEIRGMLKLKRLELAQEVREVQTRLNQVEARLNQIEREGALPRYEVVVKQVESQYVLSLRELVPNAASIGPFFLEIDRVLRRNHIEWVGPWMALYHQGEYREVDLDLEAAIPVGPQVNSPVPLGDGREMIIRELPARTMATVICCMTSQSDVYEVNLALGNWVTQHTDYQVADGPCREVYAEAPKAGEPVVFEVQLPLEPAS